MSSIAILLKELEMDVDPFATSYFVIEFYIKGKYIDQIEFSLNPINDTFMPGKELGKFGGEIIASGYDSIITRVYVPIFLSDGTYISGKLVITIDSSGNTKKEYPTEDWNPQPEIMFATNNIETKIKEIINNSVMAGGNRTVEHNPITLSTTRTRNIYVLGKIRRLFYSKGLGHYIRYKGANIPLKEAHKERSS
jgi:hypothetical protein